MHIIDFHITTFLITYIFILIITKLICYFRKKRYHNFWYYMILECYFLLLFKVTILPICILDSESLSMFQSNIGNSAIYYRLIPFSGYSQYFYSIYGIVQLLGNILLLMPIVPLLRWFLKKKFSYLRIITLILGLSLSIELIQFCINKVTQYPSHLSDINDIILNVFGGLIGIIICKAIEVKRFNLTVKMQKFLLN
jgi:glycopeptide antibiotics resistance protein